MQKFLKYFSYGIFFILLIFVLTNLYLSSERKTFVPIPNQNNKNNVPLSKKITNTELFMNLQKCEGLQETYIENCLENNYKKAPKTHENLVIMYSFLNKSEEEGKLDSTGCHTLSHTIGKLSFNPVKDLNDIFLFNVNTYISDTNCATGFYHGLMLGAESMYNETVFHDKFSVFANNLYEKFLIEKNSTQQISLLDAIHGIGHAAYIRYNDIPKALLFCGQLSQVKDVQELCYSGVFMENSFEYMTFARDFDIDHCKNYDTQYQFSCLVASRNSQEYIENNKNKYLDTCNYFINTEKLGCIQNFIYQNVHTSITNIDEITSVCNQFTGSDFNFCLQKYMTFYYDNHSGLGAKNNFKAVCAINSNIFGYVECLYSKKTSDSPYFILRPKIL